VIAGVLEIQMFAQISRLSDDMRKAERVVSDNMGKVEKSVASAKQAMQSLGMGLSIGLIANMLRTTVDSYTKLDAQLRLSTKSQQSYNQALADIRRISQVAQADISGTTMLYTRLLNVMEGTGVTQSKLNTVTETITFGLKAYGATAEEAASASLQLSQAMGANRLGGEEFRAVMEAMPNVMKVLAKSMLGPNGSVGALRALSIAGKITAAEMIKAWGNPEISAQFRKYAENAQTITGAMTTVRNELLLLIGEFAKATGFTGGTIAMFNALAGAVRIVAGYMQDLVFIAGAWVSAAIVRGVYGYIASMVAQRAAALAVAQAEMVRINMTYGASAASVMAGRAAVAHAAANMTLTGSIVSVGTAMQRFVVANPLLVAFTSIAAAVVVLRNEFENAIDPVGKFKTKINEMGLEALRAAKQMEVANLAGMWFKESFNERAARASEDRIRMLEAQIRAAEKLAAAEGKVGGVVGGVTGAGDPTRMQRIAADLQASIDADAKKISHAQAVANAWFDMKEKEKTAQEKLNYAIATQKAIELDNLEAAKKAAAEWEKTRDQIATSLTQGIMQGFENGQSASKVFEDTTKKMFRDMVLEPQIKAAVTAGVDWVREMALNTAMESKLILSQEQLIASNEKLAASNSGGTGASGAGVSGAATLFWAVFAVVAVKAYRSLTNEQSIQTTGIAGTVTMAGVTGGEYSAVERVASGFQQLFGDNGSYTRTLKAFTAQQQLQLSIVFSSAKSNVLDFADTLNLSTSALENFAMTFDIVGGSFDTLAAQITDQMAYALLGIDYSATQQAILGAYNQRILDIVVGGGDVTAASAQAEWDAMLTAALNAQLPAWFKDLQRAGESVGDTLVRVTNEINTVDSAWKNLGFSTAASFGELNGALGGVQQGSILAREALIAAMGGIDAFNAKMTEFYGKFYTESEKLANAQSNVNATFEKLGLSVPSSYAAFRELLAGLDLTTVAGQEAFAALMSVSGAFATVQDAAAALVKQQRSLDIRLQEALGNSEAALAMKRADELAAADASLRSTLRLIYAAEDRAKAENAAADAAQKLIDKVRGMQNMFGTLTDYNRALGLAGTRAAIASTGVSPFSQFSQRPEFSTMPIQSPPLSAMPMPSTPTQFVQRPEFSIMPIMGGMPLMRAFANGGDHMGGLRIVGENGPEIESTGPSRIFNANQTRSMLAGSDGNAELAAEIRGLRSDLRASQGAIALAAEKSRKILDKFDKQGLPAERVI
jgi:tape measure domain-containing protein